MTAGLPGTGIGGVFYLVSALFMPFVELFRTLRGESSIARWILVLRQLSMAGAIMTGMWLMGLFLGVVLEYFNAGETEKLNHLIQLEQSGNLAHVNIFHIAPLFFSLITLLSIVTTTHMLRFVFKPALGK